MAYKPTFTCPHCGDVMNTLLANPEEGSLDLCQCPAARERWESEHRAVIEQRKRANGKRRR